MNGPALPVAPARFVPPRVAEALAEARKAIDVKKRTDEDGISFFDAEDVVPRAGQVLHENELDLVLLSWVIKPVGNYLVVSRAGVLRHHSGDEVPVSGEWLLDLRDARQGGLSPGQAVSAALTQMTSALYRVALDLVADASKKKAAAKGSKKEAAATSALIEGTHDLPEPTIELGDVEREREAAEVAEAAKLQAEVEKEAAANPPPRDPPGLMEDDPPPARPCTCVGSCKGSAGLAPGFRCAPSPHVDADPELPPTPVGRLTLEEQAVDATVAHLSAGWDAMEAAQRHGRGSPEHVAARARADATREAMGQAQDAANAKDQAEEAPTAPGASPGAAHGKEVSHAGQVDTPPPVEVPADAAASAAGAPDSSSLPGPGGGGAPGRESADSTSSAPSAPGCETEDDWGTPERQLGRPVGSTTPAEPVVPDSVVFADHVAERKACGARWKLRPFHRALKKAPKDPCPLCERPIVLGEVYRQEKDRAQAHDRCVAILFEGRDPKTEPLVEPAPSGEEAA